VRNDCRAADSQIFGKKGRQRENQILRQVDH
jgi:hypothetical protein